jgi:hypothetical protein
MKNTRTPWKRALYLPLLAVGVALVAAVSSWASGPATSTPSQTSTPAAQVDAAPIQDTQTTPTPPQDDGPGGRDCPEKDGAGSGGDSSSSTAPQSSTEPETDV